MKFLTTLCAVLFSTILAASPLKNLVVFGDSLSDTGNLDRYLADMGLPPYAGEPYYNHHFSNGLLWNEFLMQSYFPDTAEKHLLNYSRGGAGVSPKESDTMFLTLRGEIADYLFEHGGQANADDLYLIWIGANNYLRSPEDKTVEVVNNGISYGIDRLIRAGARNVMVFNLPDLGKAPRARKIDNMLELNSETSKELSAITLKHNKILFRQMVHLRDRYPNTNFIYFDVNKVVTQMLKNPSYFGFTNTQDACYLPKPKVRSILDIEENMSDGAKIDSCEGYLFFDDIHPVTQAHKIMAQKARELLDQGGIYF
jgi:phospholipase/lecithinase/hemolysin